MKKRWFLALLVALCCLLCACGAEGDAVLYADESHDHIYGFWYNAGEVTCSTEGVQVRYCKICHQSEEKYTPIPENVTDQEHVFEDMVVPPTATEPGFVSRSCTECGYTIRVPFERTP